MCERESKKELLRKFMTILSVTVNLILVLVPLWATRSDVEDMEHRLAGMKADLLCELIGVGLCVLSAIKFDPLLRCLSCEANSLRPSNISLP